MLHTAVLRLRRVLVTAAFVAGATFLCAVPPAGAEPVKWPQPGGLGSPVVVTYSFSNLLQADFLQVLSEREIRAASAEAFRLWASHAPLHFIERVDSGPPPSTGDYYAGSHPNIRIGAIPIANPSVLARAYLPMNVAWSGLAGDIHFNSATPFLWGLGLGFPYIDFLEVLAHEIGHSLGLLHLYGPAVMSPFHGFHFDGLGTGFLFPEDIAALQAIYGVGTGSVHPIPEPATLLLVSTVALGAYGVRRARQRRIDAAARAARGARARDQCAS